MIEGKLDFEDLREIILNSRKVKREEVKVRNDVGEDCSIINFGNCDAVFSTDPITGSCNNIGKLAVQINCNDIASAGAEAVALLVTILAPPSSSLEDIKSVMEELSSEAKKMNVEVIGGHTEVTSAVNRLIVSITVIGKCAEGKSVNTSGAQVGDDIIVTKNIGLEGTCIIINDNEERVHNILSSEEISQGKSLIEDISVMEESKIATTVGVNSMHDITEGGLLGALFEVALASDTGFIVDEDKIPMLDITKKISNEFKINPLRLISSGSMLITTPVGEELVKKLEEVGIKATLIGKITKSRGILIREGKEVEVEAPKTDELFNLK